MADITIIIIEGKGPAMRKRLKEAMPESMRKTFDEIGRDVDMESGEEFRDKLPPGFPRKFVVPEEVLVFPAEEKDEVLAQRRKQIREVNTKRRRKRTPGNTEA